MNAYVTSASSLGSHNIADFVFSQIAQETLEDLAKNELKGEISLSLVKKRKNVETTIEKNKVTIDVIFSAVRDSDVQKSVKLIQESVYNAVNEATEITDLKVNVSVISFVEK